MQKLHAEKEENDLPCMEFFVKHLPPDALIAPGGVPRGDQCENSGRCFAESL